MIGPLLRTQKGPIFPWVGKVSDAAASDHQRPTCAVITPPKGAEAIPSINNLRKEGDFG